MALEHLSAGSGAGPSLLWAGVRGEMASVASMPLADPGTCTISSSAMHHSCLNRQVLMAHSRFRGGYVAEMRDCEMKEELVNLSEMKGRQGCVPQAVQGHGDPPLPRGLLLQANAVEIKAPQPNSGFKVLIEWVYFLV